MALPTLTPEQREEALRKAHAANKDRKEALSEVTSGTLTIADALAGQDVRLHKAKVNAVLRAVPGIGKVRAAQLMSGARVAENRRVQGLGDVQRKALLEQLAT